MTLRPTPDGRAEVTYRAVFTFKGLARFVTPLAAPAFRRLGDKAAEGTAPRPGIRRS